MDAACSLWALTATPALQRAHANLPLQEMLAIMKSIYDMMGRHTYPILREDTPAEHVERFFQVSAHQPCLGRGTGQRRGSRFWAPSPGQVPCPSKPLHSS